VFIANLAKGRIGHDKSSLLGSLLAMQLQLAAMARITQAEQERRDFYLVIGEFPNFSTEALPQCSRRPASPGRFGGPSFETSELRFHFASATLTPKFWRKSLERIFAHSNSLTSTATK